MTSIEWDYDFVDACEFHPETIASGKTPEQVKAEFARAGISVGSWAKANGFTRKDVYAVLSGQNKAKYGKAHAIAVALGLKEGEIVAVEAFRPVLRAA